jgi:hypothetical protein
MSLSEYRSSPVFVVGCPRSGTSLLREMLNAHPEVAIAPETHFVRRFWVNRKRYDPLTDEGNFRSLIQDVMEIPAFPELGISPEDLRSEAQGRPRTYEGLFALIMDLFGRRNSAGVVGEKTPNHLLYTDILRGWFPQSRFVHLIRDPRAVVNSWRKVPWSTSSITGDAEIWRKYQRYAEKARALPSFMEMRYEDLVSGPQEAMSEVCRFLGIAFDPRMIQRANAKVDVEREPWKSRAVDPITDEASERWRRELSAQEIGDIEAVAFPMMRLYGYEFESAPGLPTRAMKSILRLGGRLNRMVRRLLR